MGFKKNIRDIGHNLTDSRKQEKVRKAIHIRLKRALIQLRRLEKKLKDPRTRERARLEIARLRVKINHMKTEYRQAEKSAIRYTKKNPKKALAIAAAFGVLAGTILAAISPSRKKK